MRHFVGSRAATTGLCEKWIVAGIDPDARAKSGLMSLDRGASMTQAWVVLTNTDGLDISAPSESQLATALAQVYKGTSSDGNENTAVLRFGYDDGLMYEVEVGSGGNVKFEEWSDQDREIALESPKTMSALSQSDALQLWTWLAQRQVAKIRSQPWR
ncbi:MAG: hypothetical protein ACI83P_000969 [Janthinobacterium sp.]|jgi:hypothetical protein